MHPEAGEIAAEWVPLASLKPWAQNPRKNSKAIKAVADSIKRFGFGAPILARRADREIIAGHTRASAAEKLGLSIVPVRFLDLDEEEAHKLAVADNALGELAEWDDNALASLVADWRRDGDTLTELALSTERMRELFDIAHPAISDDEAPEPTDGPWSSEVGASYRLGDHLLVVGDSTSEPIVRATLDGVEPAIQLVDPPFDLDYTAWTIEKSASVVVVWHRSDAFFPFAASLVAQGYGSHSLVFCGGVRGQHNHTLPSCMHENVTVFRRKWWNDKAEALDREALKLSGARLAKDGRHISWQEHSGGVLTGYGGMSWGKPVMQYCVALSYAPRGSVVWDPCAGSGSSLIAAQKLARIWRGCELTPKWADLIRVRWTRWCRANNVEPGSGALDG